MSRYLESIQNGIKEAGNGVVITGSTCLIEIVEREQKTSSGLIMPTKREGKEYVEGIVVATGAGYYNDEAEEGEERDVPLDTKVGDIVFVEPSAVKQLYMFPVKNYQPNTIGIIDESQIQIRFRGEEAIKAFKRGAGIAE